MTGLLTAGQRLLLLPHLTRPDPSLLLLPRLTRPDPSLLLLPRLMRPDPRSPRVLMAPIRRHCTPAKLVCLWLSKLWTTPHTFFGSCLLNSLCSLDHAMTEEQITNALDVLFSSFGANHVKFRRNGTSGQPYAFVQFEVCQSYARVLPLKQLIRVLGNRGCQTSPGQAWKPCRIPEHPRRNCRLAS
jgi:hypothetical protein